MIVLDANILLYAYDSSAGMHRAACAWVEDVFTNGEMVGLPWQTIGAFLRISTNRGLPGARLSVEEATDVVDQWLEQPHVRVLAPGESHWGLLRQMIRDGQAAGPLATDARLAAITIEYGGVLHTTDRDFARFPGLRWKNPLITTRS